MAEYYEDVELPIKICGLWNEYVVLQGSYGTLPETIRTLKSKLTGETDPEILDEMTNEFMEYKVIKNGCLNWKDFKQVKQMQKNAYNSN